MICLLRVLRTILVMRITAERSSDADEMSLDSVFVSLSRPVLLTLYTGRYWQHIPSVLVFATHCQPPPPSQHLPAVSGSSAVARYEEKGGPRLPRPQMNRCLGVTTFLALMYLMTIRVILWPRIRVLWVMVRTRDSCYDKLHWPSL